MSLCIDDRTLCRFGWVSSKPAHKTVIYRVTYTRCCTDTITSPDDSPLLKYDKNNSYFLIISRSVLLRMRNVSDRILIISRSVLLRMRNVSDRILIISRSVLLRMRNVWDRILIISRSVLLRMRNVSDRIWTEIRNMHFIFENTFYYKNRAVYQIMWKNIAKSDRPQMTIWRMRISCWIPNTTNTHSEYVILITFQRKQWL